MSRRFAGIEEVTTQLGKEGELKKPPVWFGNLVTQATDLWFDPKSFESKEMYERLGIRTFKEYVPMGEVTSKLVWESTHKNAFITGSSEQDLRNYERFTRISETLHLFALPIMVVLPIMGGGIGSRLLNGDLGDLGAAALIASLNILGNVYPVFLQRYNRLRLYKAIEHAQTRDANRQQSNLGQEKIEE